MGAKFCPNCGVAIESQSAPVGEQPKAPAVERSKNPIKSVTESSGQQKAYTKAARHCGGGVSAIHRDRCCPQFVWE